MKWDSRKIVKGSAIKDLWENTNATFWTEDWDGNVSNVSLGNDIKADTWYEIDYDKGKIEIYPVEFLDTEIALKKELFG